MVPSLSKKKQSIKDIKETSPLPSLKRHVADQPKVTKAKFLVKAVPVKLKRSVLPKIPLMKSQKVVMVLRPKDVYVAVHM